MKVHRWEGPTQVVGMAQRSVRNVTRDIGNCLDRGCITALPAEKHRDVSALGNQFKGTTKATT